MTATLVRVYTSPDKPLAFALGNMQVLPNDNVFISWGNAPIISEFSHEGELLFDAHYPPNVESYRAFRFPWKGQPTEAPTLVAESGPEKKVTLYVSWNGATEVATWEVLAGPHPDQVDPLGSVPRDGFETAMLMQTAEPYVAVQAKHRSGRVLGTSKTIMPKT